MTEQFALNSLHLFSPLTPSFAHWRPMGDNAHCGDSEESCVSFRAHDTQFYFPVDGHMMQELWRELSP